MEQVDNNLSEQDLAALQSPEVLQPMPGEEGGFVLTPEKSEQVAQLLKLAADQGSQVALDPESARMLPQPVWLNLSRIRTVRKYRPADLTLTVETGITMGTLNELLTQDNLQFPLSYPEDMLLSEVLAEDVAALESGRYGYPRDYVLGLEIATTDGEITHCGGEVVKNVTGYDLNKLYTGSHHTLGVVTAATLKLIARPERQQPWILDLDHLAEAMDLIRSLCQEGYPVLRCELAHRNCFQGQGMVASVSETDWLMLLEMAGYDAQLKQIAPTLKKRFAPYEQEKIRPQYGKRLLRFRESGKPLPLVIELAVPSGQVALWAERLLQFFPIEKHQQGLRTRPTAGLLWLIWQHAHIPPLEILEESLSSFASELALAGGHLALAEFPSQYLPLAQRLNLPSDPQLRRLSEALQKRYDPTGVLFSRKLPFRLPIPPETDTQ